MATESDLNSNSAAINQLFNFLEERLRRLVHLDMDQRDEPLKQMLLYTLIDAISARTFPNLTSNRERFVNVLCCFSDWEYATSISWPHLAELLASLHKDCRFSKVVNKYSQISGNYEHGEFRNLELDPTFDSVKEVWPLPPDKAAGKITSLNSLRHAELMYESRNRLVHEHLESGYGWDVSGKSTHAFYMGLIDDNDTSIQLVYPVGLVAKLAESVVVNSRQWFVSQDKDPYASILEGSFYIPKLNKKRNQL